MNRNIYLIALTTTFLITIAGGCTRGDRGHTEEQTSRSDSLSSVYRENGQQITARTFATLSGHLLSALESEGVAGAVRYCNLQAYPLVDSLSSFYQAEIRRTSLNVRNQANTPRGEERQILETYRDLLTAGKPAQSIITQTGDTVMYYAPIFVNALCLQCHGISGTTMRPEDDAFIRELYPGDQATGYAEGDLRGMWSIRFRASE